MGERRAVGRYLRFDVSLAWRTRDLSREGGPGKQIQLESGRSMHPPCGEGEGWEDAS